MMDIVFGILFFLYGLVIGSFLNVCIYRLPRHNLLESKTSYCPNCHHKLAWYDLFPLFSFLFLRGRCRYCKEKISFRYPLVEGGNAVLWLLCYLLRSDWAGVALSCVFCSVLLVIAFIDLDVMEIPNGLVFTVLILGLARFVLSFFFGSVLWWEYLVGAACVSLPFLAVALFTGGGIGGGDIKLCFVVGLFLGWKLTLLGTLFGVIIAGVASVSLMVKYGKSKKAMIPLAPSLVAGYIIALFAGEALIQAVF